VTRNEELAVLAACGGLGGMIQAQLLAKADRQHEDAPPSPVVSVP